MLVTHDAKLAARCQRQVEMDSGVLTEPTLEASDKSQTISNNINEIEIETKISVSQEG